MACCGKCLEEGVSEGKAPCDSGKDLEEGFLMDKFIYQNGKKLRCGYTTGSCATGASLGALLNLMDKRAEGVQIKALNGWEIPLVLHNQSRKEMEATASIIKDPGDDPDITRGIHIFSRVSWGRPEDTEGYFINEKKNIYLTGGEGVGTVTKKGLQVGPGYSAINPGPRQMIFETLEDLIPEGREISIEIEIPEGREKARKTFNPKLGIEGGLSILGSTGIVKPMSEDALIDSLKIELSVWREESGRDDVVFTFGNYGKKFIDESTEYTASEAIVTSNYIGVMIDEAYRLGFKRIFLAGHIGKFVKLAGGIFNTHSKMADARLEILTACAVIAGEEREILEKVVGSNTTEEAVGYIKSPAVWQAVGERALKYLRERTYGEVEIDIAFFSFEEGKLYESEVR